MLSWLRTTEDTCIFAAFDFTEFCMHRNTQLCRLSWEGWDQKARHGRRNGVSTAHPVATRKPEPQRSESEEQHHHTMTPWNKPARLPSLRSWGPAAGRQSVLWESGLDLWPRWWERVRVHHKLPRLLTTSFAAALQSWSQSTSTEPRPLSIGCFDWLLLHF